LRGAPFFAREPSALDLYTPGLRSDPNAFRPGHPLAQGSQGDIGILGYGSADESLGGLQTPLPPTGGGERGTLPRLAPALQQPLDKRTAHRKADGKLGLGLLPGRNGPDNPVP
jgi:hypothetical protein